MINLSQIIFNKFDERYDTDQEIRLLYDAILDLNKSSINDENTNNQGEDDPI